MQNLEISQDQQRSEERQKHLLEQQYSQFLESLMKFLANNPQTEKLLKIWSANTETLVVTYYFWLSGTKLQRRLKGLLSSVVRQIMIGNRDMFEISLQTDRNILTKRSIDDWSDKALQQLLMQVADLLVGPVCIFVDGLDEFDQGDDVDNLLSLIETLSRSSKIKTCVSSRPEHYIVKRLEKHRKLRLQDLTENDMRLCIRHELQHARTQCPPAYVDDQRFEDIIKVIAKKADGVFLWVHYALRSLVRGMRNEDNFWTLLDRVEQLPSGMSQLYLQMWNRLNEDQQLYREEAATFFSYASFEFAHPRRLSLFELMVALDQTLQGDILDKFEPHSSFDLVRRCQHLKTRILTRCAGLLELKVDNNGDQSLYLSKSPELIREVLSSESSDILSDKPISEDDIDSLRVQYRTKIMFLHRTVRDFLFETQEGKALMGEPVHTHDTLFRNLISGRLVARVQGLEDFDRIRLWTDEIISEFGGLESEHEVNLLITTKRLHEIQDGKFAHFGESWGGMMIWVCDFETSAAFYGCAQYLRHFVQHSKSTISSYYRGLLVASAAEGLSHFHSTKHLNLITWLSSTGPDMFTNHVFLDDLVSNPAAGFLGEILSIGALRDEFLRGQAADAMPIFLPVLHDSSHECLVSFGYRHVSEPFISLDRERPSGRMLRHGIEDMLLQMSFSKVYLLAIKYLRRYLSLGPQWK